MKEYIIEKNVPIPESEESKCPFAEMEIGDSFFISLAEWVDLTMFGGGLQRFVDFYAPGKEFVYRPAWKANWLVGDTPGFRVWRIK